ncbi:MAG: hypothetical protein B6D44_02150 [Ignavibacteriales bacterium UTCHB2]|jgi:predicted ATP-grasp superfamily ATP-dependent carboligase|nr:MAG: hypothetical protein B6D44_02150 [Ignavibacteriales bacterium UTCHB2]
MKILIGEISSYKAIVIAKYIKTFYPDILVFSYDFKKSVKFIHTKYSDKHFHINFNGIETYLKEISEIISKENIDYFFPVHSDFIGYILKNKNIFNNSLSYSGNYEHYCSLHNKDILHNLASTLGVDVPKSYKSFKDSVIPFIGKPVASSSSKGVFYFLTKKDIKNFNEQKISNYVFQEFVKGVGCGYSVYTINGQIKSGYGHIRLAEYPISGGSSVYRSSYYISKMKEVVQKILSKVPWTGFAMFEFKLTDKGQLILIEVNPRIWGSVNQGLQNGINYFDSIFKQAVYKSSGKLKNKEIKTYLSPQIYISLLLYILKGNIKPIIIFLKNIKYNKADVSLFTDPFGWMSLIFRKLL